MIDSLNYDINDLQLKCFRHRSTSINTGLKNNNLKYDESKGEGLDQNMLFEFNEY